MLLALVIAAVFSAATPAVAEGTGLPLPRFVSVRADEANLRTGPGVQYPVDWVYRRQDLPVEVIAEYSNWRKVRDWQGTQGWMHQSMLSGRRNVIVAGEMRPLFERPDPKARQRALLEVGVIGRLVECPDGSRWCRVAFDDHEGWMHRDGLWGVYRHEVVQ